MGLKIAIYSESHVHTVLHIDQAPPRFPFDDESDDDEDEEDYDLREIGSDVEVDINEPGSDDE